MSGPFSSPFGANSNPFGGNQSQMHSLVEEDENDPRTPPASTFSSPFGGPFGGDASADPSFHSDNYPAQYNFNRRTSVSAESLKPSADTYDNWTPPFHEKTPEQLERLKKAIEGNFLFSHLEDEQSSQILGALVEKPIPAKGIKVRKPSSYHGRASPLESPCDVLANKFTGY
jgi:cAMP-dependent protein kinase regulator